MAMIHASETIRGRNAAHVAAICGCPNVILALIEYGIFDAMETDAFGNTVLHLAVRAKLDHGRNFAAIFRIP